MFSHGNLTLLRCLQRQLLVCMLRELQLHCCRIFSCGMSDCMNEDFVVKARILNQGKETEMHEIHRIH